MRNSLYNLTNRIFAKRGETVDVIQINALLCNARQRRAVMIESMEKFDEFYILRIKVLRKTSFRKHMINIRSIKL